MAEAKPLNALTLLCNLSKLHEGLWSTEKRQRASNSELRRFILNGSLEINYVCDRDPFEIIDYPVVSVVVHPKSKKHRNTLHLIDVKTLKGRAA